MASLQLIDLMEYYCVDLGGTSTTTLFRGNRFLHGDRIHPPYVGHHPSQVAAKGNNVHRSVDSPADRLGWAVTVLSGLITRARPTWMDKSISGLTVLSFRRAADHIVTRGLAHLYAGSEHGTKPGRHCVQMGYPTAAGLINPSGARF